MTQNNLSFNTIHNATVFVDTNISISATIHNQTHVDTNLLYHNYRHYYLPK